MTDILTPVEDTVGGPHRTRDYLPQSNGICVGRRPVGRSRDRWDDAVRRDAVDLLRLGEVEGDSTKQKVGVFGVRGGPGPKTCGGSMGRGGGGGVSF